MRKLEILRKKCIDGVLFYSYVNYKDVGLSIEQFRHNLSFGSHWEYATYLNWFLFIFIYLLRPQWNLCNIKFNNYE